MSNEVAVSGMTLEIVEGSPTTVTGIITILDLPSIINKAEGKGAYLDGLQIQISNIQSPDAVPPASIPAPAPVLASINASITKCKENGTLFLITGDETNILNAIPLQPATPSNIPYPVTFKVRITNANQNVWRVK